MTEPSKPFSPRRSWGLVLLLTLTLLGCRGGTPAGAKPSTSVTPNLPTDGLPYLVDPVPDGSFDHDPTDFTQGLIYSQGALYESTGRNGESKLRRLNAATGLVEKTQKLAEQHFGEGLAAFDGKLYQLTWTSSVCFVYDQKTLALEKELFYNGQGWGLATSPSEKLLIFSDGTETVRFLDPSNLITKRTVTVTDGQGQPVGNVNELEWVRGELWANIWMTDRIARIDPQTGKVKSWLLLPKLSGQEHDETEDVMNGIAYDPDADVLWLTGKLWNRVYRFDDVEEKFFSQDSPER